MKASSKIERLLNDLETFGWDGGRKADVMQRIVEIASKEFIEEMVRKNGATAILAYGHMGGLNLMQAAHTLARVAGMLSRYVVMGMETPQYT